MGRLRYLSVLCFLFLFAGLLARNGTLIAFAVPFIVVITTGLLTAPKEINITATRKIAKIRAIHAETVDVILTITNGGPALELVEIVDRVPEGLAVIEGSVTCLTSLRSGEECTISYSVRVSRGYYQFTTTTITARDRLGLTQRSIEAGAHGELYALPDLKSAGRIPIKPEKLLLHSGPIPSRTGGEGIQFFDIREYQPGDQLRHLNWRATAAKPDHLFTNEYEREHITEVGIILDARQATFPATEDLQLFERSILASSALAESFLNAGHRVGLLIYGKSMAWTYPGYGKRQREKILTALSAAEIGSTYISEQLDYLPTRLFPAKSQLILVSPLVREDIAVLQRLRSYGYSLFVVSPDPVDFEIAGTKSIDYGDPAAGGERLPAPNETKSRRITRLAEKLAVIERKLIIRELEPASIFVLDWKSGRTFPEAVASQRGKINAWQQKRGVI